MNTRYRSIIALFLSAGIFFSVQLTAQTTTGEQRITVVPGPQYQRSNLHQFLWGRHYRKEWTTPASFPVLLLDTAAGGLIPYQAGGGNQSKSLRLRNANGKEYVLRSVDKNFDKALPDIYENTFVERKLDDQVSVAHPYAALTVPQMAAAAGIYHTYPQIVFVPRQAALDSFNDAYGDKLYLFEQRPDENWEEAANFGNAKKIIGTDKLFEKLQESNKIKVDQEAFVKARLFDMLIGDWGRHEDQWRWAEIDENGKTVYKPIPRDRDQLYTKFDGLLLNIALAAAGLGHLESFEPRIDDIKSYNYPARYLDRRLTNTATLEQWTAAARGLQAALTDGVIEQAVRALPPEIFPISGEKIIAAIKKRREDLVQYATDYYLFLAEEVDVPGTRDAELFEVVHSGNGTTAVKLYALQNGMVAGTPFYSRIFSQKETDELRLYGIAGNDRYKVSGTDGVKVRIIGGVDRDSISIGNGKRKNTVLYDNHDNFIDGMDQAKLKLSEDTSIHSYRYDAFHYDDKGFQPRLFYNYEDRLYVGVGYEIKKQKWRREPFAYEHGLYAGYSLIQGGVSLTYKGTVHEFAKNWSLHLFANFDAIRWTNFFGLGNETKELTDDRDFYRLRTREIGARVAISRQVGKWSSISIGPYYQTTKIIDDKERFVAQVFPTDYLRETKHFTGGILSFLFSRLNDPVFPRSGFEILTTASHNIDVRNTQIAFQRYEAGAGLYVPIFRRWVVAMRGGIGTVTGEPNFFQMASIGGSNSLRGYRRDRFWGRSSFFNSNELQYQFNIRSFLFNGKAALFALYDMGQVTPGSPDAGAFAGLFSQDMHTAYGGGISFAPFNKVMFSLAYAISRENGILHIRVGKTL